MKNMAEHFDEEAGGYDRYFLDTLGMRAFYDEIQKLLEACDSRGDILVLGCGTGLELERILFRANVTAIDISQEMLRVVEGKDLYPDMNLRLLCGSYMDLGFGHDSYDIVLSCYSLHHFTKEQKNGLYSKISAALRKGGKFINGDTVAKDIQQESELLSQAEAIYRENNACFGSLHVDVPLTAQSEYELLNHAGFESVYTAKEWTNTTILCAQK